MHELTCFKAYDVRGRLGENLDEDIAWRIGRAYAMQIKPKVVAVGGDVRPSSAPLKAALSDGLRSAGASVLDLGLTGTEEIYFAVFSQKLDGGIEVTGSHNPISDNGLKFVRAESRPISGDTGLFEIKKLAEAMSCERPTASGEYHQASFKKEYVEHLLSYIAPQNIHPLRIVTNAGNGAAGPVLDILEARFKSLGVPLEFIKVHHEPDGSFPHGLPNPLLPENRSATANAVKQHKADLGLAWDGDFDRCFFFDENAEFIEGYYMVGLLAEAFLANHHGATIIHDPRLIWNTTDIVHAAGGKPVQSKTGHAFIKERMRAEKAVYGGEMSAHHYFANFAYCDSGMIPWLLVVELMSRKKANLSELVAERQGKFPCSGEINYRVKNAPELLQRIEAKYAATALKIEHADGLSADMGEWRFNMRSSNTEPLLRLNLETRGNTSLVWVKVAELEEMITQ